MLLDDEQAVALAVALQLATTTGAGIEEAAARALTTIRQVMPARLRHRIDTLHVTNVERPTTRPGPQAEGPVLQAISAAVRRSEMLRFDYASTSTSRGDLAPRRVEPHNLVAWSGRCYLVAWDLDRDGWRTFRADRITPRTPTGPSFTPRDLPGGDVAAYVVGTFQGTAGWACHGEVVLHLSAEAVSPYIDDGLVEPLGPDRCRLVLGSWSWAALAATLGRFGSDIDVIRPPELNDAFALHARRYARAATGDNPISR